MYSISSRHLIRSTGQRTAWRSRTLGLSVSNAGARSAFLMVTNDFTLAVLFTTLALLLARRFEACSVRFVPCCLAFALPD